MDVRKIDAREEEWALRDGTDIIRAMYDGFNRRDIAAVLEHLAENVEWANGMSGGHEQGCDAVREYWTKQWAGVQPNVEPSKITERSARVIAVEVHQIVRDLEGKILLDENVRHVFHLTRGLIERFDIETAGGLSSISHN